MTAVDEEKMSPSPGKECPKGDVIVPRASKSLLRSFEMNEPNRSILSIFFVFFRELL